MIIINQCDDENEMKKTKKKNKKEEKLKIKKLQQFHFLIPLSLIFNKIQQKKNIPLDPFPYIGIIQSAKRAVPVKYITSIVEHSIVNNLYR